MRSPLVVLTVVASLVLAACSGDDTTTTPSSTSPATTTVSETTAPDTDTGGTDTTVPPTTPSGTEPPAVFVPAAFEAAAGTEQITITGADPGSELLAVDADNTPVASGIVDEFGALIFRALEGGSPYTVWDGDRRSEVVTTLDRDEHPDSAFHAEQRLPTEGLGYITTRDGTTLSASVWLPGPADAGPYPTVVEYSGYTPSNPESVGFPDAFTALGYAYVGVNIRGTGCSGGSFRFFEYAQNLDGYDAIETVAAQPWVMHGHVGMVGFSYPGISQLFTAQTQPPSLAAITPFSALADSMISTLYPGGILNTGFALPWITDLTEEAGPEGQEWAATRIEAGDEECAANQQLRLQNPDLVGLIAENQFWTDEVAGELAPRLFVDRITAPTFVAGAWQDEQTGGHFPTMLDRFTGTDHLYASLTNGLHPESVSPAVLPRLIEFLDLYVAERTPTLATARVLAPLLAGGLFGTTDVALPADDRFAGLSHAEALAEFEAEPPIRVLFEQGAADGVTPLAPLPRFEAAFEAWPIPEAEARRWYLDRQSLDGRTGVLGDAPIGAGAASSYLALPDAVPPTWYDGSSNGIWSVDVEYDWQEGGPGTFLAFATEPLGEEVTVIGSGSVDLWMRSNLGDTDIEVTISEIRPDGQELYVQSGWLRASHRALDDAESTELRPVHTHLEADAEPLADEIVCTADTCEGPDLVRVELFPFAHVFRSGSRIRLTIDAPGGNRPVWEFQTIAGGEEVTVHHDATFPSSLVLPVVAGVEAPDEYPACDSLRGQPCRPYAGD